ncbi:hypothetical protein F5Y16DRAFT_384767 [Xylariaceae sp. FL0255]|nr:hypothetical protein F5Y16DRAFT_384767 [Xylariaceae sp. FL0255]
MGRLGGKYFGLERLPEAKPKRRLIRQDWIMGQTIFRAELFLGDGFGRPPLPQHRAFGKTWFVEVQNLWRRGIIRPYPIREHAGLDNVTKGADRLRRGEVFGEKLVYTKS